VPPEEEEEAPSDMMAVTTWLIETEHVDRKRGQRAAGDDDQRATEVTIGRRTRANPRSINTRSELVAWTKSDR
jgi:hypothetical protein